MTKKRSTTTHLRILRATSADAFPALEIEAAAPARLVDTNNVVALGNLDDDQQFVWAAELTATLRTHEAAVRRLAENAEGWDFHLRVLGHEGEAPTSDFLVSASHLPADDFEALASGFELGELDVVAVVGPMGSATFIRGSETAN